MPTKRFNPYTARWEEAPPARADTALERQLAIPDDVAPGDLVVGSPGARVGVPMLGRTDKITLPAVNPAPSQLASGSGMIPIAPPQDLTPEQQSRVAANERAMGLDQPPGLSSLPDLRREADAAAAATTPAPLPAAPPAPAPKKPAAAGGGGGGGPAAGQPGHLTKDESLAQGQQEIAQEGQEQALAAQGDLAARQAAAEATQAEEHAKAVEAAQADWKTKREAAEKHLQEREDAASKMKITDIFEGRPLRAIAAAISAGIGARAAAITGTENTAQRTLELGASAFRAKQQAMYERQMAGVKNEQDRLQYATMQAAADEAGLYRRFEMSRTSLLKSFGADKARLDNDTLLADFRAKQADRKALIATMLHDRGQQEVLQAAQVSQMRASAAHAYAETEKTRTETENIRAGGGPMGRAPVEAQKEVAALTDGLNTIARAMNYDDATFKEVGANMVAWNRKQALDKTPGTKQFRSLAQATGWADVAPEQGLRTDKGRELHQTIQRVLTSAAKEYGGVITEGDRDAAASELAAAGANPQAFRKALGNIGSRWAQKRDQYLQNNRITLPAAPAASPAASAAPPRLSPAELSRQIAGADSWLRQHPDDKEVQAKLRELLAQRRGG